MPDTTNPRAALDEALKAMRGLRYAAPTREHITSSAMVACAEALALLVDAHLAAAPEPEPEPEPDPEPEPEPCESLPDDTPVGHGWVMVRNGRSLFKTHSNGSFMLWFRNARKWGSPGYWPESELDDFRPATIGDLRRVGLPVTEWPDITEPGPEVEQSEAEAIAARDNAIAALRAIRDRLELGVRLTDPNGGIRKGYQESLYIVKTEARSHGIDLSEEVS